MNSFTITKIYSFKVIRSIDTIQSQGNKILSS